MNRQTRHKNPCADCAHYVPLYVGYGGVIDASCQSEHTPYPSAVHGSYKKEPKDIRADKDNCGPEGVFWKAKQETD
jgi:hypothetical protein